ncbi:hypothetical protein LPB136_07295 [Tenacibaculum todarodis]|uniref:Lipoprotein n=1 Tax=Tenacibaculum todarodis TaxID=1850252 RepID=A0A1L3JJ40_9FLAO|nr:hypothetical protein [Tenacibaculum todarodis]APG65165.1 hypothetical protein LPB136_07295 [Tenacibaculum todarodis]
MKNLVLSACASVLFLGLTSCSNNESLDNVELGTQGKLLKSYKLQKDVNGRYSMDYTLNDNTTAEVVKSNGAKEIYLYAGELTGTKKNSEELSLDNNQLSVDFVEDSQSKTSFVIEDEDIVLAKGESNIKFLQQHSFFVNKEEQTVELDFKVRKGVNVSFAYNEAEEIYEIHLKEGESKGTTFSKIFSNDGNPIKIDFVNHLNEFSRSESVSASLVRRPRSIIIL